MMDNDSLKRLLEEIFSDVYNVQVARYSSDGILNKPRATEGSVREVYHLLRKRGLSDTEIASQANLLGLDPKTLPIVQLLRRMDGDDGRDYQKELRDYLILNLFLRI